MRIDIHVHTIKTKSGESPHRNIDAERFVEIIKQTDVRILAITNHNHFNLEQFRQIEDKTKDICQIWPGVELDIREGDRQGHLLVIANPANTEFFAKRVELLCGNNYDRFFASINDVVENFEDLDVIYIPHYSGKKPNLLDGT